jgi:predicted metalloprotease with PDZ domain
VLGQVAGDPAFADDFFARYIQGHEIVNYEHLLADAGFLVRPRAPQAGFAGEVRLQDAPLGVRIAGVTPTGSPFYRAGLDRDDMITAIGGTAVMRVDQVDSAIRGSRPGASLAVTYLHHGRAPVMTATIQVIADPRLEVVPAEQAGQTLTAAQRQFRNAWLKSNAGNGF